MPNTPVKFKLGPQTKINEYLNGGTGWEVGTFYLTSDSNRLYVGQADGIQLLNKVVQVYSSLDQLPSASQAHEGDFAYISGSSTNTDGNGNAGKGNILAKRFRFCASYSCFSCKVICSPVSQFTKTSSLFLKISLNLLNLVIF